MKINRTTLILLSLLALVIIIVLIQGWQDKKQYSVLRAGNEFVNIKIYDDSGSECKIITKAKIKEVSKNPFTGDISIVYLEQDIYTEDFTLQYVRIPKTFILHCWIGDSYTPPASTRIESANRHSAPSEAPPF